MTRKLFVQIFLLPNLKSLAAFLRLKDADSSGADDEAAEAIDFAVARVENWLNSGE